jgi:pimeloyl-ACP methyl ester carboxylesterase
VVILHGISSSATAFARVFSPLREAHQRVIALDAPGHGFSQLPREPLHPETIFLGLEEALHTLHQEERFVLFGNSMGGAMALRFALDHGERLRGLILSSPAGAYMDEQALQEFLGQFSMDKLPNAREFVRRLYHKEPWYGGLLAPLIRQQFLRPQILQFFRAASPEQLFSPEELAGLKTPTLFLWGRSERLMRSEHFAYFQANLPKHVVIEQPERVGHCPQLERPFMLAKRITRFVASLEG